MVAMLMAANAHAQVTMALSDNGGPPGGGYFAADYNSLFTATLAGYVNPNTGNNQIIAGNDLIGIYQFTVTAGGSPSLNTPFYATCISPAGNLYTGNYTYNSVTLANADNGMNPHGYWAGWNNVNGGPGIQNAAYLYSKLAPGIISGAGSGNTQPSDDQGAAMALAMYTVLYNSTGYGTYNSAFGGPGAFQITGGLQTSGSAVYTDYIADLNEGVLGTLHGSSSSVTGNELVPTDPTAQGMILMGGYANGSPVPEPTTIIAGALMLLPFGASTLRILRKNRAA